MQTGLPMAALSVLGAQWRLKSEDRAFLTTEMLPWSLQAGTRCADLMCLDYEDHFKVGSQSAAAPLCAQLGARLQELLCKQ